MLTAARSFAVAGVTLALGGAATALLHGLDAMHRYFGVLGVAATLVAVGGAVFLIGVAFSEIDKRMALREEARAALKNRFDR